MTRSVSPVDCSPIRNRRLFPRRDRVLQRGTSNQPSFLRCLFRAQSGSPAIKSRSRLLLTLETCARVVSFGMKMNDRVRARVVSALAPVAFPPREPDFPAPALHGYCGGMPRALKLCVGFAIHLDVRSRGHALLTCRLSLTSSSPHLTK